MNSSNIVRHLLFNFITAITKSNHEKRLLGRWNYNISKEQY